MDTFLDPACVYGPVQSRRFGRSLGVNLNPASGKRCTFDCIYCELGTNAERRTDEGFPQAEDIASALEEKLAELAEAGTLPDTITLAGNGEPTANPAFPKVVDAALALRDSFCPKARVGVLSNSTLAHLPRIHAALERLDDPVMKLDTADSAFIELVDRPCAGYSVERTIEALASFGGSVIVQTMFLKGEAAGHAIDNTGDAYVLPWIAALERIAPRQVQAYTVARATPFPGLRKASSSELDHIRDEVEARGIPCIVAY